MRLRYGFWACPVPKCPKLSGKQIRCPEHDKLMCKVTLRLERPQDPRDPLSRAIDELQSILRK